MTIFTIINDIIFKKTGKLMDKDENKPFFSLYLLQRWASMLGNNDLLLLNKTINIIYKGLTDKDIAYKMLIKVIPKRKYQKITYIKKDTDKTTTDKNIEYKNNIIDLLANNYQLSRREVSTYINDYNIDITNLIKSYKKNK